MIEINLDELEDETRCSVCLSIINNTRLVSVCMHRFCAACIETWLRNSKSNSCPACRKPLQSRRDCKPDPRFDELLRLLYGSVEEYEEDVLMPLAEEATAVRPMHHMCGVHAWSPHTACQDHWARAAAGCHPAPPKGWHAHCCRGACTSKSARGRQRHDTRTADDPVTAEKDSQGSTGPIVGAGGSDTGTGGVGVTAQRSAHDAGASATVDDALGAAAVGRTRRRVVGAAMAPGAAIVHGGGAQDVCAAQAQGQGVLLGYLLSRCQKQKAQYGDVELVVSQGQPPLVDSATVGSLARGLLDTQEDLVVHVV